MRTFYLASWWRRTVKSWWLVGNEEYAILMNYMRCSFFRWDKTSNETITMSIGLYSSISSVKKRPNYHNAAGRLSTFGPWFLQVQWQWVCRQCGFTSTTYTEETVNIAENMVAARSLMSAVYNAITAGDVLHSWYWAALIGKANDLDCINYGLTDCGDFTRELAIKAVICTRSYADQMDDPIGLISW